MIHPNQWKKNRIVNTPEAKSDWDNQLHIYLLLPPKLPFDNKRNNCPHDSCFYFSQSWCRNLLIIRSIFVLSAIPQIYVVYQSDSTSRRLSAESKEKLTVASPFLLYGWLLLTVSNLIAVIWTSLFTIVWNISFQDARHIWSVRHYTATHLV